MAVTESLVSGQNEASHQQAINTIQQGMLEMFATTAAATGAAIVSSILNPGARAKAIQETLQADIPDEQVRTKGAQTTPPVTP